QVQAGALPLELDEVDLASIAEQSFEAALPFAEEKGVQVQFQTGEVPVVVGDRGRLGQLLDNLLSNAIKFTPEGGRIDLVVREDGGAVIEVRDTGIGIPPAEQERLFERFFR